MSWDCNGYTVKVTVKSGPPVFFHNILHIDAVEVEGGQSLWAFEYAPYPNLLFLDRAGQYRGACVHLVRSADLREIERVDEV